MFFNSRVSNKYYISFNALLFLIFLTHATSCQSPDKLKKTIPQSEATAAEQEEIYSTVDEIQSLAASVGITRDFKNFPVVIITDDVLNRKAKAYCDHGTEGVGLYIAIMKSTLEEYRILFKPHGKNSFLFMLLVHEFGHCFFNRSHDENTALDVDGHSVPISAMMIKSPNILGMQELSKTLKLYYLKEIAGLNPSADLPIESFDLLQKN